MKVYEIIQESRVQLSENVWADLLTKIFKTGGKGEVKASVTTFIKGSSEGYAKALLDAERAGLKPPGLVEFLDEQAKTASKQKKGWPDMDPAYKTREVLDQIDSNARKILKDLRKGGSAAKAGGKIAEEYGTSDGVKKSLGILKKTWLWTNFGTTIALLLFQPLGTYANNMEAARKYLELGDEGFQQLKSAGQLKDMTINGQEPQNVEEWFVLYNHAQLDVALAKMLESFTVTLAVSSAGFFLFGKVATIAGKFVAGLSTLNKGATIAAPAAFNLYLAAMNTDPAPNALVIGIVMGTWLGKLTWAADLYQKYRIPDVNESIKRYNAVVDKVNTGLTTDANKSKQDDADKTTPVDQGGKTAEPNETPPAEQPAVTTPAAPVDKSTWKRDWQGYPINPATGIAELD
jgi:hypothetical protein